MEIDAALEEGVELIELSAPVGIVAKDGRLEALTCIRMELGEPDASGRRSPVKMKGSEYDLKCDFAISAIGQDIDLGHITDDGALKTSRGNVIVTDKATLQTSIPGVFAGGDVITGPAVAIDAIAHGKVAADSIDKYLSAGDISIAARGFTSKKDDFGAIPESEFASFPKIGKEKMGELPVTERIKTFKEVELGFTGDQVVNETARCLECGCSAFFDCALRKYATEFDVDIARFVGDVRQYKIDKAHPFIALDPNKCINCGRCVRTCSEILKVSALGFVNRGFRSVVKPSMEKELLDTTCISCGNCVAACPTGAITEKVPFSKPGPWAHKDVESVCTFCSVGCSLSYKVFGDHLFTIKNVDGGSHNLGYLCAKGRWGYRYMLEGERQMTPAIKKDGVHKAAAWDEAFEHAAARLNAIIKANGPESVAVFASPRMTNEELYLLQKFVRTGLKTNNIGSFSNLLNGVDLDALDAMFGITTSTATMDEIPRADVVIVINADLSEDNLIAELKVKAAQKTGTRLVTVNSSEIPLNKFSDLWVDPKRGTGATLINGLSRALIEKGAVDKKFIGERTEGFDAFRTSVAGLDMGAVSIATGVETEKLAAFYDLVAKPDQNVVVLYNIDSLWEKSKDDLKAIGDFLMLTGRIGKAGNGLVILRDFSNSQGLFDMGGDSRYLPGNVPGWDASRIKEVGSRWGTDLKAIFKPVDLKDAIEKGAIKAVLVFGEDPLGETMNLKLFGKAEFVLAVDTAMTATAMAAEVVLPASLPVETSGHITSCDRRVQKVNKVFEPFTGLENWQIIAGLGQAMGIAAPYKSVEEISAEIASVVPAYQGVAEGSFWGEDLLKDRFMTATGKGKFAPVTVSKAAQSGHKKTYLHSERYFEKQVKERIRG